MGGVGLPRDRLETLVPLERVLPVLILLVDLDERGDGVGVVGLESDHLAERVEGAVAEARALEVHPETQEGVGALAPGEPGTMEHALMDLDGALELTLLAEEVAEDEEDLDGFGVLPRGDGELGDRAIGLS